jgi:hypothetical protein
MNRWVVLALGIGAAIAAACNPPDSNPKDVISMTVDTAPAPSVVAGDTMRIGDSTTLGRLHATAYNISGIVLGVPILWLTLNPTIVTTDTFGHVFALTDSIPAQPRIIAEAGGLQTLPFTLNVVPRPDSVARDTTDTAQSLRGFCSKQGPLSTPFNATVLHRALLGDSTPVGVNSYAGIEREVIESPLNLDR